MMKIKTLMLAMMAFVAATVSLTSCSDDDNETNYSRYQKAVDSEVSANKKHDKAILLVAFGSTWQQAFDAFDETKKAYQKEFPDYDVYVSFSSAICINRAAAGEHASEGAQVRNYYAPNFWLHAFGTAKYKEIVVQSLQVIPGEEFARVVNYLKDFANNNLGDLDDAYLSKVELKLGTPLLDSKEDVGECATELDKLYGSLASQGVVAFMGHGNPNEYDTYNANKRYEQLQDSLQEWHSKNYFVGTVDAPESYKTFVYKNMVKAGKTSGKVFLHPLMSIAGDHANNDMAGDDGEDIAKEDWEYNEEGEIEDLSWKVYFSKLKYECDDNTCIVKGLLELPGVRNIWIKHTRAAVEGEPLDGYYHSKNPAEE